MLATSFSESDPIRTFADVREATRSLLRSHGSLVESKIGKDSGGAGRV